MNKMYQSNNPGFQAYLRNFGLSRAQVAQQAQVPQAVVWRVEHGQPVRVLTANRIRVALYKLTNFPYTGSIALFEQPTMKLRAVRLQPQGGAR